MRTFILVFAFILLLLSSLFIWFKQIDCANYNIIIESERLLFRVSSFLRTMALVIAGVGLSVSGLIMQQISLNKFVSPTTAGTLDAAKLGILIGLILFPGTSHLTQMGFAFLFTILASLIFMQMLRHIKQRSLIYIPLLGIMFGNVLAAIGTFFGYRFDIIQNMETWLIGDFSKVLQGN